MYIALDSTKEINSFKDVVIPKPRDLYARYGARQGDSGLYATDGEIGEVLLLNQGSVIDQMTRAQNLLNKGYENVSEAQRNELNLTR